MRKRLPDWLKRGIIDTEKTRKVRSILRENHLNTVCDAARCPNKNECYSKKTATFMILGNTCSRNCRFCSVQSGNTEPVNLNEPAAIADAVIQLGLDYVVITSVTRDDLEDGGANHFAETIKRIKKANSSIKVEVLTPDFKGNQELIDIVINAKPDVFNHNIETIERLYSAVRPQASYKRSLEFIKYIKTNAPEVYTKSGIMVGLGEDFDEIIDTIKDLNSYGCDIVTIGQYIQPTSAHYEVNRYLTPDEFEKIESAAKNIGVKYVFSGPLVRSSYKAKDIFSKS